MRNPVCAWVVSSGLSLAMLFGCGASEDVIVKTADGVELTAQDIDRAPLALLPGGSLGTFNIDAPKLFQSAAGSRLLAILQARLPLPASAGFVPERDLDRILLGLYSFQGADFVGVASGRFSPEAIENAAKAGQVTPLGAPLVQVTYAGRVFYVSANVGCVVLTPQTVIFGNETGIRRALDRLEAGRIGVEVSPAIETLLRTSTAPLAFGSDAQHDPQVSAFAEQLPFLKGMSLLRVLGNFDPPGINLAGTLTYTDAAAAEQGKANLLQLHQNIASYGFLAAVLGIAQPITRLDAQVVDTSVQASVALDGQATASLIATLADAMGAKTP